MNIEPKGDLKFVGMFRGRNLFIETADKGIAQLFEDWMVYLEKQSRLAEEMIALEEREKFRNKIK